MEKQYNEEIQILSNKYISLLKYIDQKNISPILIAEDGESLLISPKIKYKLNIINNKFNNNVINNDDLDYFIDCFFNKIKKNYWILSRAYDFSIFDLLPKVLSKKLIYKIEKEWNIIK